LYEFVPIGVGRPTEELEPNARAVDMNDHRVGGKRLAVRQFELDLDELPQRRWIIHTQRQPVKTHVGHGSRQGLLADFEDCSGFHWKPAVTAPFVHRVLETSARSWLSAYIKVRPHLLEKKSLER